MTTKQLPILLGYQSRWVQDKSRVKVAQKSRRVGLTWAEAGDNVLTAAAHNGQDVWYIGYNKEMAQEYINSCADWAAIYQSAASHIEEELLADEDKDILTYKITFASGKRITALSSRPSNLRGKQGVVVIDEAAFHENLEELLKAAMALLMWGGEVHIISTHNGEDNPFNEIIQDILKGRLPYALHTITLDDALADGLYQRICEKTKQEYTKEKEQQWRDELIKSYGDSADEELFTIPKNSAGAYLKRSLIESCMQPDIPILHYKVADDFVAKGDELRASLTLRWCDSNIKPIVDSLQQFKSYIGVDFARSGDLSVFIIGQEMQDMKLQTAFMVELRNVPFTDQEQIFKYIADNVPRFTTAALDSRGNGQYLGERATQKYGKRAAAIQVTPNWYTETMPKLKAAFEDSDIVIPRDVDVLDDLRTIEVINAVPKIPDGRKQSRRDSGNRHGDSAVAIAMMIYANRCMEDSGVVEYISVSERSEIATLGKGTY